MGYDEAGKPTPEKPTGVVPSLQICQGWFDGRAAGSHHYILLKPGRTSDKRLPCAAAPTSGAPSAVPGLRPLAVSACLQWRDGTQHNRPMCDLTDGWQWPRLVSLAATVAAPWAVVEAVGVRPTEARVLNCEYP